MARSSELRAYSHIWEAAEDPNAPLLVVRLPSAGQDWYSVATFRTKASGRPAHKRYSVQLPPTRPPYCSCPWFSDRRNETRSCKHVELVRQALYIRRGLGTPLPIAESFGSLPPSSTHADPAPGQA